MGKNRKTGQIIGPFQGYQDLFELIQKDTEEEIFSIKHIGIQTGENDFTSIVINDEEYVIGPCGFYEIGNTEITSLFFINDADNDVIIDYVI